MKLFVTGVSGYIGGSVADGLLKAGHAVTGLVRSEDKAGRLKRLGIEPILGRLEDLELMTKAAQDSDGVIHAASADDAAPVHTLIAALEGSGKLLIHTSGSSIVADQSNSDYVSATVFTEDMPFHPVPFRQTRVAMNHAVRQAGIEKAIRSIVICPPMIYGKGRGLQEHSDQIPKLTAVSQQVGAGVYLGKGQARYSNVHINDLVDLYLLVIEKAPAAAFFFAENGEASFFEIAELISQTLGYEGRTQSLSIDDVVAQMGEAARYGAAANSRVSAVNARRLGWTPKGPTLADVVLART